LKKNYNDKININSLASRIKHIKQSAFNSKKIVVFSGGNAKGDEEILEEIKQIKDGGGNGSIIGRNTFQRSKKNALDLLNKIIKIYKN
jgi:class I fructose-bisphosphate aldolase